MRGFREDRVCQCEARNTDEELHSHCSSNSNLNCSEGDVCRGELHNRADKLNRRPLIAAIDGPGLLNSRAKKLEIPHADLSHYGKSSNAPTSSTIQCRKSDPSKEIPRCPLPEFGDHVYWLPTGYILINP